jgi:hypothetical protein
MSELRPWGMPLASRRSRDHGIRIVAAVLAAATIAGTAQAAKPSSVMDSGFTQGNCNIFGSYTSDVLLDVDGDGIPDFALHITPSPSPNSSGPVVTLQPLVTGGLKNQIFEAVLPTTPNSIIGGGGLGLNRAGLPNGVLRAMAVLPTKDFPTPGDVLTANGPVITDPDQGDLSQFPLGTTGEVGVVLHVPPNESLNSVAGYGHDDLAFIEITPTSQGVVISNDGIHALSSSTPTSTTTWGRLKNLYR